MFLTLWQPPGSTQTDTLSPYSTLFRSQQAGRVSLQPEYRAAMEDALSYPEESACRLMQRDLVAVPEYMTVCQVIDYLREHNDLTTDFWEIFVVDEQHKPIVTCQLSWVLRCPRGIPLSDVMKREQTLIPVDMDQEEVALRLQQYALSSDAVVDGNGRLRSEEHTSELQSL